MRTHVRVLWTLYFTLTLLALVIPAAGAYIDPGSTSMIFQALVAAVAAAGVGIKIFWSRLKSLFGSGDTSQGSSSREET